ncbi:3-deoxy-D-manno-octulosonic acid transferase [Aurantibacter crassamenti]|uniref:3-deoxy-D-manno-octulosonic acid transferase n=1 Tax=Aurantibacter crassamenti TaxID=1837375 RepID=UPI00193A512D|nr:glycosyltransferase N-terminal domain-containing protein [Aurantibacter crassamenti]MBM1105921.1 3-deoxy-D-manno-octulosonic acid transferase [Aurantibacter crassamenti]
MYFIYNLFVQFAWLLLQLIALFNKKISLFVKGRKNTFAVLNKQISPKDEVIWVHVASLGEFEQGLPIIEKLKLEYPTYKILVTFFSPSGYEVKKETKVADAVCYLPMDTIGNAHKFLNKVNPKLAIFIKYEIWPNFLNELQKRKTPTILVSAIFNKNQVYFKSYGGFMRKALKRFQHIFVQDEKSSTLLRSIKINNVTISGDTRFDRVAQILERDNYNETIQNFKQNQTCFVAGSSWPEDEQIIVTTINSSSLPIKWIIAPHNIKLDQIEKLKNSIKKKTALYSERNQLDTQNYDVIIIDNIGLLTQIYSYADIAYVGGGFATGLHNTLEPAVFGIPVIIGPNYHGFKEAEEMVKIKGIQLISNTEGFKQLLDEFLDKNQYSLMKEAGAINANYVTENKGASIQITSYIRTLL